MKSFLLLALVFAVSQALESSFARTTLSQFDRTDLLGQRSSRHRSQGSGFGSRPGSYTRGNLHGGQRDSYFRDSFDDVRGLEYSLRPGRHQSGSRGHLGGAYNRPLSRYEDCYGQSSLGYRTRRCRYPFGSSLANTGRYDLGGQMFGNGNLGYY